MLLLMDLRLNIVIPKLSVLVGESFLRLGDSEISIGGFVDRVPDGILRDVD